MVIFVHGTDSFMTLCALSGLAFIAFKKWNNIFASVPYLRYYKVGKKAIAIKKGLNVFSFRLSRNIHARGRGGFRGGAGSDFFFQGFDLLPTQRVPPLYYFEISIFCDGP